MQSISAEEREQLVGPFAEAVCVTLREWAGTEAAMQAVDPEQVPAADDDLAAILPLQSPVMNALVLRFPRAVATPLARRVFAEVAGEVDESLLHDCMGEVANVVAGQAKALLHGTTYRFTFSTPRVVSGSDDPLPPGRNGRNLVLTFASDLGNFALEVALGV